jgi:hemerythrin superfamily protein
MTQAEQKNVIDLLLAQHEEIKTLFAQLALVSGQEKTELFNDLVRLLAVHETAEEEVVHPAARRNIDDGDDIVQERLEEEREAKQALAELYDLGVDHPEFDSRLDELAISVTEHAMMEETQEFPALREVLQPAELRRMAGAVKAAQAIAPTRPHPAAGESAAANVLLGPPAAVFDRVADAVRDWRNNGD